MTAPTAIPDLVSLQARIASITSQLSAVFVPPSARTTNSATTFASQLASATATTAATGTSSSAVTGSEVVADAQKYLGVPYVYAGESTSGIDCSGLTQKTFKDLGITIPRVAADQQKVGTPVASLADAQPGDLLFFGQPAYHVAIYAGNNKLIESPEPGKTVQEVAIYQKPTSISRIVGSSVDTTAAASGLNSTGNSLSTGQITAAGLNPAVAQYASQFAAAEKQFNLPSGMLAAVAQQESGGNSQAVSSAGAQGLMQLMPSTAAGIGVNAFDPSSSNHRGRPDPRTQPQRVRRLGPAGPRGVQRRRGRGAEVRRHSAVHRNAELREEHHRDDGGRAMTMMIVASAPEPILVDGPSAPTHSPDPSAGPGTSAPNGSAFHEALRDAGDPARSSARPGNDHPRRARSGDDRQRPTRRSGQRHRAPPSRRRSPLCRRHCRSSPRSRPQRQRPRRPRTVQSRPRWPRRSA